MSVEECVNIMEGKGVEVRNDNNDISKKVDLDGRKGKSMGNISESCNVGGDTCFSHGHEEEQWTYQLGLVQNLKPNEEGVNSKFSGEESGEEAKPFVEENLDSASADDRGTRKFKVSKKSRRMVDIEDQLLDKITKRKIEKARKKFGKQSQCSTGKSMRKKVVNESLSDGDFINVNKLFCRKEAIETWNLGKQLGLTANGNEQISISKIDEMVARDRNREV